MQATLRYVRALMRDETAILLNGTSLAAPIAGFCLVDIYDIHLECSLDEAPTMLRRTRRS